MSGSLYKSPFLDLKGGLWIFTKSKKISKVLDKYILNYAKKIEGGGQIAPHNSNRVKRVSLNETPKFSVWGVNICEDFNLRNKKTKETT